MENIIKNGKGETLSFHETKHRKEEETLESVATSLAENTSKITTINQVVVYAETFPRLTGETDDSARLQRMINTIPRYGNQNNPWTHQTLPKVIFAPQQYTISSTLDFRFRNDLNIDFNGAEIKWLGASGGTMFNFQECSYLKMHDAYFNGNSLASTVLLAGSTALSVDSNFPSHNTTGWHVENLRVNGMHLTTGSPVFDLVGYPNDQSGGIPTNKSWSSSLQDSTWINTYVNADGAGILSDIGFRLGTTELKFIGGDITGCNEAFELLVGTSVTFHGIIWTGTNGTALMTNAQGLIAHIRFTDCYFEGITTAVLQSKDTGISTSINKVKFDGCVFNTNANTKFIDTTGLTTNINIVSCDFADGGTGSTAINVSSNSSLIILDSFNSTKQPTITGTQRYAWFTSSGMTATGNINLGSGSLLNLGTAGALLKVGGTGGAPIINAGNGDGIYLRPNGGSGTYQTQFDTAGNAVVTGQVRTTGGLGVGNSATASTLGTLTKKMQVFDASGNSLGYIPIYSSIT